VPPEWASWVKPAFEYWKTHRELFDNGKGPRDGKALIAIMTADNPVLAFMGCRALAKAGMLRLDDVPKDALAPHDDLGVMIAYLLLANTPPAENERVFGEMGRRIDGAKSCEELHGIALACVLDMDAVPYANPTSQPKRSTFGLLLRIESRSKALTVEGMADPYLQMSLARVRRWRHWQTRHSGMSATRPVGP
jgi:hypothetical protein